MASSALRSSRCLRLVLMVALATCMLVAAAPATAAAGVVTTTQVERDAAAAGALAKVGRPYRSGAVGPGAFDCSGLADFAYRIARHPLGVRTSFEMWNLGARVQRRGLRPGDLVWTWDRRLGHVGIYVGGGRYVHAPGAGRRVEVAPLPSGRAYVGAVRP